ncbi:hypothetical protein [Cellulomonas bogoriensis]|uniref:Pilus assembly protein CpaE n=1 Tax=Cellulomonas bogoriensis 69B4 = DSM 16987 TaxID=1386082 RepID=A0A0A0C2K5_9CELL|nr:hypothetical protein [Cellulomonas bogoriensis]KGM14415.1 pilus assembly protein CpaE [Cellulomonas bogoriensis 69B4 = DSM 16987]
MISAELAAALRDEGVRWDPVAGDRFVIPQPGLDEELFTLSEMTIEARRYPTGTILGFNGTTEWALDSVALEEALWMPREDQLRDLLGGAFESLVRAATGEGEDEAAGAEAETGVPVYEVTTRVGDRPVSVHRAQEPADAYALALLALVASAHE